MQDSADWWSSLSYTERDKVNFHERSADRKHKAADELLENEGSDYVIRKLRKEAAGHLAMVEEYRARGIDRTKLGITPKLTGWQRKKRHMEEQRQAT